jgi:hypothetical protein
MKKAVIVIVILIALLYCGCSNVITDNPIQDNELKGKIVIIFTKEKGIEASSAKTIPADTTAIYVRAWNSSVSVPVSVDVSTDQTSAIEIAVPVGTYTVDAFAVKTVSYQKRISTYGYKSNIDVEANQTTNASITLNVPDLSFTFKDINGNVVTELVGATQYTVQASSSTFSYIGSKSGKDRTPFLNFYDGATCLLDDFVVSGQKSFTSPSVTETKNLTMKPFLFLNGEFNDILYFYPGDQTIKVTPPSGSIIIGLN